MEWKPITRSISALCSTVGMIDEIPSSDIGQIESVIEWNICNPSQWYLRWSSHERRVSPRYINWYFLSTDLKPSVLEAISSVCSTICGMELVDDHSVGFVVCYEDVCTSNGSVNCPLESEFHSKICGSEAENPTTLLQYKSFPVTLFKYIFCSSQLNISV